MKPCRIERMAQIETILAGEMDMPQIAKAIGLSESVTWSYVTALQDEKRVRISGWRIDRFAIVKLYRAGSGPGAPRPRRIKPEKGEEQRMVLRTQWVSNPKRDPLVVALFGAAA